MDASADGRELVLRIGETLVLALAENRTTGYRWQFISNAEPVCKLRGDHIEPAGSLGAGGAHTWEFEATATGEAHLNMAYARAWDPAGSPAGTFEVSLKVEQA